MGWHKKRSFPKKRPYFTLFLDFGYDKIGK